MTDPDLPFPADRQHFPFKGRRVQDLCVFKAESDRRAQPVIDRSAVPAVHHEEIRIDFQSCAPFRFTEETETLSQRQKGQLRQLPLCFQQIAAGL